MDAASVARWWPRLLPTGSFEDAEADESYTIVLANPVGVTVRKGTAVIRIVNDD